MSSSIFFGGSILAAIIAGAIALFAPCCISVMLPAYFASSFQNRRLLVAMTFLFAAGIATIILPLALGASIIRQLLTNEHSAIYVTGGALMLTLAMYILLGGQIHLPMPGRRAGGKVGFLSVYSLGLFSGMATSCCAPVLAGVIALSSVVASFWLALGLGLAYVFGMVAPLFVIALLWDQYDWRTSQLFRSRSFTWRIGSFTRTVTATTLVSGLLLVAIGASMVWVGLAYHSMPPLANWQIGLSESLQHIGQVIVNALAWMPNWFGLVLFLAILSGLAWIALKQIGVWRGKEEDIVTTITHDALVPTLTPTINEQEAPLEKAHTQEKEHSER